MINASGNLDASATFLAQYANSPRLTALMQAFNGEIDPRADVTNFYNFVWNVNTAQGFGLDIWGKIVNIPRSIQILPPADYLGFKEASPGSYPFGQEPFYTGKASATAMYLLSDPAYRVLILTKALANISTFTAPSVNTLLRFLFAGRGSCYMLEQGGMSIQYVFNFALQSWEASVLQQPSLLPRPAGVTVHGVENVTSTVTAEQFFVGNGTATTATLTIKGNAVSGSPTVTAIHQTDWQGRLLLYNTPRTNLFSTSEWQVANLTASGGTPAPANATMVVPGYKTANAVSFPASPTVTQYAYETVTFTAGSTYSISALVQMADNSQPAFSLSSASGDLSFILGGIIATNGTISYYSVGGGVWRVTLSGCVVGTVLANFAGVAKYTTQSTKAFTVTGIQVASGSIIGAYIPTTTAAVTETDYTLSSASVTFGQAPISKAVCDWDGTGTVTTSW